MATPSITYTLVENTLAKANEVNTNFSDIVSFLTNQVIHRDASVAFTAIPSGPASNPTSDNQFTRKAYVDVPYVMLSAASASLIGSTGASPYTRTWTTVGVRDVTIPTQPNHYVEIQKSGVYEVGFWISFETNSTTGRRAGGLRHNSDSGTFLCNDTQNGGSYTSGWGERVQGHSFVELAAGDTVRLMYSLDLLGLDSSARMWVVGVPGTF